MALEKNRMGQLTKPVQAAVNFSTTTYGGGITEVRAPERLDASDGIAGTVLKFLDSARTLVCWTPVTANTHVNRYIYLLPNRYFSPVFGAPLRLRRSES